MPVSQFSNLITIYLDFLCILCYTQLPSPAKVVLGFFYTSQFFRWQHWLKSETFVFWNFAFVNHTYCLIIFLIFWGKSLPSYLNSSVLQFRGVIMAYIMSLLKVLSPLSRSTGWVKLSAHNCFNTMVWVKLNTLCIFPNEQKCIYTGLILSPYSNHTNVTDSETEHWRVRRVKNQSHVWDIKIKCITLSVCVAVCKSHLFNKAAEQNGSQTLF